MSLILRSRSGRCVPALLAVWWLMAAVTPPLASAQPGASRDARVAAARALDTGRYDEVHTLVAALATDATAAVLRARAFVAVGK